MEYKISLCTTCMGRLTHLQQTLPRNLEDSASYPQSEFVVLNYNSPDEIHAWMEESMKPYIESGRLKYIKTSEPDHFRFAHAKNMAAKFATGDILCNIDADNFTGPGFTHYVNEQFNRERDIFLTGREEKLTNLSERDLTGRVCVWKDDFLKIQGYDEAFVDYGYEDIDLYARLSAMGRMERKIGNAAHLKSIKHDHTLRMRNGKYMREIDRALSSTTEHAIDAYILKVGQSGEHLTLSKATFEVTRSEPVQWHADENAIGIMASDSAELVILKTEDGGRTYRLEDRVYELVPKADACYQYAIFQAQMIYRRNSEHAKIVNPDGFGEGNVRVISFDS